MNNESGRTNVVWGIDFVNKKAKSAFSKLRENSTRLWAICSGIAISAATALTYDVIDEKVTGTDPRIAYAVCNFDASTGREAGSNFKKGDRFVVTDSLGGFIWVDSKSKLVDESRAYQERFFAFENPDGASQAVDREFGAGNPSSQKCKLQPIPFEFCYSQRLPGDEIINWEQQAEDFDGPRGGMKLEVRRQSGIVEYVAGRQGKCERTETPRDRIESLIRKSVHDNFQINPDIPDSIKYSSAFSVRIRLRIKQNGVLNCEPVLISENNDVEKRVCGAIKINEEAFKFEATKIPGGMQSYEEFNLVLEISRKSSNPASE
jgi:hypothetical protein